MKIIDSGDRGLVPASVVDFLNGPRGPWLQLDHPGFLAQTHKERTRINEEAVRKFRESIRELVDRWIKSGIASDGLDEPLKRNIRRVLPKYNATLNDLLKPWDDRHKPRSVRLDSGERVIIFHDPNRVEPEPLVYASESALFWFTELLDSPGANRICRCSHCERYYIRARTRKKEIKRGTYCAKCVPASSVARMKASREARKQELIKLAAKDWNNWPTTHRTKSETKSEWIANRVNKHIDDKNRRITGRWVTQNQPQIEAKVGQGSSPNAR